MLLGNLNKDGLREKGTTNIVSAIQKWGVKRLICLSAFGTAESRKALPWYYRAIIALFITRTFKDHKAQDLIIRNCGLAETVKFEKLKISPADVADFLVKQLSATNWLHKAAILSN